MSGRHFAERTDPCQPRADKFPLVAVVVLLAPFGLSRQAAAT